MKDLQTWSDLNRGVRKTAEEPKKNHWYEMYKLECLKTKKLQEENAELEEQLRFAKEMPYSAVKKFAEEKTQDQLTKAKELIEDMYDAIPASHSNYYKDVMERARQFISEVEK